MGIKLTRMTTLSFGKQISILKKIMAFSNNHFYRFSKVRTRPVFARTVTATETCYGSNDLPFNEE